MRNESEDLLLRLDAAERKAAIWRSQVVVLLLVFILGGAVALLWARASLASRIEKVETRVVNVAADSIKQLKVVEAEAFVLRDATGKIRVELQNGGQVFFDEKGMGARSSTKAAPLCTGQTATRSFTPTGRAAS